MLLSPFLILSLTGILIILSGWMAYASWTSVHPLLFGWLWFNLWIAIYEMYIVYRRKQLTDEKCQPGFWSKDSSPSTFWKDAWNEYTCFSDTRYLDSNDFVFVIELINAILVLMMWFLVMTKQIGGVYVLLLLQAYHCGIYFISLWYSKNINIIYPIKFYGYLAISLLWIVIPIYILSTTVIATK